MCKKKAIGDKSFYKEMQNDYSTITILGLHGKTKRIYVIDGSIYKLLPDNLFSVVIEKLNIFLVEKIGFETTQAQSYMKQKFEEQLWHNEIYAPIEEVVAKGHKYERIITLEPEIKKGHILFNPSSIGYNNQVKKIRFFDRNLLF